MTQDMPFDFATRWPALLRAALEAAVSGGASIMEVYRREITVDYKADHSPLTEADRASHEHILERLQTTGLPVVSEESEAIAAAARLRWRTLWLVDPLDGTKEFIKRNGDFTVNIALIHDHRVLLGVVYVPDAQELYIGVSGVGAFRAEGISDPDSLAQATDAFPLVGAPFAPLSAPPCPTTPLRVVASRSHCSSDTLSFIERLKGGGLEVEQVSRGSSLKLCMIASGKAHIYPRLAPTMEWDTAAAQAVVECAGGAVVVYDASTHAAFTQNGLSALFKAEPLTYNRTNQTNPWFVALHPALEHL